MKKIILTLALCIALSSTGNATCWGTSVTGNNNHTYCISTQTMNWYAAFGWCDAQGRHLVSINEACDYDGVVYGQSTDQCPNMSNISGPGGETWTASPCNSSQGLTSCYISVPGKWVGVAINGGRNRLMRAFCY